MAANDASGETLHVTVCHAAASGAWQQVVRLPRGATLAQAIAASDFAAHFPHVDAIAAGVGVYGVACAPTRVLQDGDRVEIYRPLVFDPMESRRRRARHKAEREAAAKRG